MNPVAVMTPTGAVRVQPNGDGTVQLHVSSHNIGVLVLLSPEQAEVIAAALELAVIDSRPKGTT